MGYECRFLNDSTEVQYGRQRLQACVDQIIADGGKVLEFANLLRDAVEPTNFQSRNEQLFVISFTTQRDDLNSWRHYGDDGYGVCFGFRVADLVKTYRKNNEFGVDLRAVHYREEEQLDLVRLHIEKMISIADASDPFASTFLAMFLMNTAPTFKPLAFQSESEWRLVVGNFVTERIPECARPLRFRARGRSVLPYVEVDISPNANLQPDHPFDRIKAELLPVAGVIVGSKMSRRDQVALRLALDAFGHKAVQLEKSVLPMA